MSARIVFLHGPAAAGKLTVARRLAAITGLPLFHNHLAVDLATALFEFGSPPFVRLRDAVWMAAFEAAARAGRSLIFTFNPEATVPADFVSRVVATVQEHGGEVLFVRLDCPEEEIERRIENDSRAEHGKLRSLGAYRKLRDAGAFEFPELPEPLLRIDTGALPPEAAARRIADALERAG